MQELVSQIAPPAQASAPEVPAARVTAARAEIEALLTTAAEAPSSDLRELAASVNRVLERLPKNGGRPAAELLTSLLDQGRLAELVDWEGRTCRAAAADALIGLGYPYALELSPEDLEHLREGGAFGTPAPYLLSGLGLVAATSGLELVAQAGLEPLTLAHTALTLGSATAVALTRPLSKARRWAQAALLLAGAEGIALSVLDTPAALLSGLAAVAAAALMAKTR